MEIQLQEALFAFHREVYSRCKPSGPILSQSEERSDTFLRNVGVVVFQKTAFFIDIAVEISNCIDPYRLQKPNISKEYIDSIFKYK
jgi:hypothetical protein